MSRKAGGMTPQQEEGGGKTDRSVTLRDRIADAISHDLICTTGQLDARKMADSVLAVLVAADVETTFTCKVCGLKTHDLTRPCPHWWNLLLGGFR